MSDFHFLIVTPSYNQAQFIRQTIESVLNQKQRVTYWVMDGGSKDQTVGILKKFSSRLHWESAHDKGQTDAINKGIKKFQSELWNENTVFTYINSDDYYLPRAFQKVANTFEQN